MSPFGWQITARDTGTGAAYLVGTTDTLPANWTYDAGSAQVSVNGGPASQLDPAVSTAAGVQTLTWTDLGNLAAGTALTITFTATPQPGVTGSPGVGIAVNQTNSASSTAQDLTGATGNASGAYTNGAGTATAHIGSADLTLTKAVGTGAGRRPVGKLAAHRAQQRAGHRQRPVHRHRPVQQPGAGRRQPTSSPPAPAGPVPARRR